MRTRMGQIPMGAPPTQYGAKDYFIYAAVLATGIASGNTGSASFNVDNDSDFLWQKGTFFANVANDGFDSGSVPIPGVTVVIKDTTSGRDIMSQAVPISALFGTGELPFILPVPKLLPKTSTLTFSFANITDNTSYSFLGLYLHGQKLFG